jgi:N-acetylglucosamine-6-phosphate deacetylase
MVQTFRELTGCPLWQAVRMASLTPAQIVGVAAELGSLAPGKRADIILFDEQINVRGVYLGGRRAMATAA